MTIFVSIAAYRDHDLGATLRDCIAKARWPDALRFGVCWQYAADETPPPDLGRKRMRLISLPWYESRGACWARAELMKLYDGEDWFLQLDSHHRFAQGWDALLLDQAERSGSALPLLTTYGAPFTPGEPLAPGEPTAIKLYCFRGDGTPSTGVWIRPDFADRAAPVPARYLSAHLLFAPGRFVADVPYDPELYFYGEEITLAIRAFTHGYDLLHPSRHVLWHQDPRRLTPLHWDDHVAGQGVAVTAAERDAASLAKVARFLHHRPIGPFACGTARSFADYEAYSGLDFVRHSASPAAKRGDDPVKPVPLHAWRLRIGIDRQALPAAAFDQPRFWYVGVHDDDDVEIARHDADRLELSAALALGSERIVIERQVRSNRPPTRWTVWPVDRRGCWTERLSGTVVAEQVA
ncbi:MAG: hypothetical protein JWL96_2499 [Sphingomonas bacterium]|uniref:GlcNAc-transferase family protein n=1 Tax=Sphingomonas bacterium TaxID=1895847 RepID=UPI002614CD40|nr:GlcNAc-transferase family protein [Sphingomonas bacterium]MDB5710429.1 hypothetical protein [Sphingomonas bacterium]